MNRPCAVRNKVLAFERISGRDAHDPGARTSRSLFDASFLAAMSITATRTKGLPYQNGTAECEILARRNPVFLSQKPVTAGEYASTGLQPAIQHGYCADQRASEQHLTSDIRKVQTRVQHSSINSSGWSLGEKPGNVDVSGHQSDNGRGTSWTVPCQPME